MNKKIIKNLIMVIASALLLLAATLAWFATIDTASVEPISTSIDKIEVDYEVEDENGNWVDISSSTTTTGMLIPGKEYRYRAIVTAPENKDVLGYSVSLEGLKVTDPDSAAELEYDVREHTFIRSYVVEGAGDPPTDVENYEFASYIGKGVENISIVRIGYFGESADDEEEDETTTEAPTEPQAPSVVIKAGEKVTIYYSLMIPGQDIGDEHNILSNATLEIGKVNIIMMYDDATTNETPDPGENSDPDNIPEA